MVLRHQTNGTTKFQNGVFEDLESNGIRFDAADKLLLPQQIEIKNFTVKETKNRYQSFINVFENSKLTIKDSDFQRCFSFEKGGVLSGGYQNAYISIENSSFIQNGAQKGGVFSASDRSVVICDQCKLEDNFALSSGGVLAISNGFFELS